MKALLVMLSTVVLTACDSRNVVCPSLAYESLTLLVTDSVTGHGGPPPVPGPKSRWAIHPVRRVSQTLRVSTGEQVVESTCGTMRQWPGHSSGVLAGTVTRNGVPQADAEVTVEYVDEKGVRNVLGKSRLKTGDSGTFTFCGAPRDVPLRLRVVTGGGEAVTVPVRLAADQLWATADLAIDQPSDLKTARYSSRNR